MSTRTRTSPGVTLATSQEIRDRGSTFVGYVYRARTVDEARAAAAAAAALGYHGEGSGGFHVGGEDMTRGDGKSGKDGKSKSKVHGPYTIAAWRCMAVKPGRTGLGGPDDFTIEEGCEDGGERWAGGRVLGVMKREGVIDAVVVVCRWFGGTLLGPVRFTHIETCAGEVCRRFRKIEEMDECVQTLRTLDDLLAALRAELAAARTQDSSSSTAENSRTTKVPDYRTMQDSLDLTKAKRLIHARECAINATKTLIEKYKTST
ncbi:hypothetical protein OG21DRAFT_1488909 [Imleria badia]|nr:hypothetical protein OG21DRAFT_1488909 [Imleria badia]